MKAWAALTARPVSRPRVKVKAMGTARRLAAASMGGAQLAEVKREMDVIGGGG